jgi:hypothetical protein
MKSEIINLFALLTLGLAYLFLFAKIQHRFFLPLSQPRKNNAVLIVFVASLISASINLVHIAELAADAMRFFLNSNNYGFCALFSIGFFAGMWVFSLILFRLSYLVVGYLTPEKENDELLKNNIEIALMHAVILISLSFIIGPALVNIASEFIPYPEMPY